MLVSLDRVHCDTPYILDSGGRMGKHRIIVISFTLKSL